MGVSVRGYERLLGKMETLVNYNFLNDLEDHFKMIQKLRKVTLKGLSENIPDFVTVDISGLDLGQTVKVNKLQVEGCEILNPMSNPVATIDIPRALRGKLTA